MGQYPRDGRAFGVHADRARTGEGFIPDAYEPFPSDVRFVGAMGIFGIISYGFTFVGAIAFMQFSLYAFQAGKPEDRPASYYKGRMAFYCSMLLMAGLSQLFLGVYIIKNFGGGELELGTIAVAVYVVNFPGMCVLVGLVQTFHALWGLARTGDVLVFGRDDVSFQIGMLFSWLFQVLFQVVVQVSYSPGGEMAGAAPMITALSVGLNLMPAFLDYKRRTVPEPITPEYYGLEEKSEALESDESSV